MWVCPCIRMVDLWHVDSFWLKSKVDRSINLSCFLCLYNQQRGETGHVVTIKWYGKTWRGLLFASYLTRIVHFRMTVFTHPPIDFERCDFCLSAGSKISFLYSQVRVSWNLVIHYAIYMHFKWFEFIYTPNGQVIGFCNLPLATLYAHFVLIFTIIHKVMCSILYLKSRSLQV